MLVMLTQINLSNTALFCIVYALFRRMKQFSVVFVGPYYMHHSNIVGCFCLHLCMCKNAPDRMGMSF